MLEHFGLKDIWVVTKKNRNLIALVSALFLILFSFITYGKLKNSNESSEEGKPLYAYSLSYYVQTNIAGESFENSKDGEFYRGLPNDYIALLNTDACASYVYENLSKIYSEEYLKKNSEFKPQSSGDFTSAQAVKDLYKVKRYKSTMIFNVYAVAYNQELSKSILNILRQYLEDNIDPKIKEANLEPSSEAVKVVNSTEELGADEEEAKSVTASFSSKKKVMKVCIKNIVVPMIGIIVLLLFALTFKAFLSPTMNRKSDFAIYDVPVIGEIKDK